MSKIKLKEDRNLKGWYAPGMKPTKVSYALPFYKSNRGEYMHRVRSSIAHWRDGKLLHISLHFWCDGDGFLHKGQMFANPPDDSIYCAACEGKAIGAGEDGARIINGRNVKFSPRRKREQ